MVSTTKTAQLFIAEEQELFRDAYVTFLDRYSEVDVVGTSPTLDDSALIEGVREAQPNVLLLGMRTLTATTVDQLRLLRREVPGAALVVLSYSYDVKGISALREFSRRSSTGCAYLLKHTISSIDQLVQVINSVLEGRIIVDPGVLEELVTVKEPRAGMLKHLSPREMEVLGWMSRAYRNNAIAHILHLEPKTVERHINNIYGKLGDCPESKHPRAHAIALFLMSAGYRPPGMSLDEADDPLAEMAYEKPASADKFQPAMTARKAMEGANSLAGAR